MNCKTYKGYYVPLFDLDNLSRITVKDLLRKDYCLARSMSDRGDRYDCDDQNDCGKCLLNIPDWRGNDNGARGILIAYMIDKGYLSKEDSLELSLEYLSKKE